MPSQLLKKINFPAPGRYIIAVSGGVDSVVLLDLLAAREELELVVAHFDHGIRPDSARDRRFVKKLAKSYGLKCITKRGRLGKGASEAAARRGRYRFLAAAKRRHKARAIITAHHLDDRLETSLFNALRGSRRAGLIGIRSHRKLQRPLLQLTKAELRKLARDRGLTWREDPSNRELAYARNFIRRVLVPLALGLQADLYQRYQRVSTRLAAEHERETVFVQEFLASHQERRGTKAALRRYPLAVESKPRQLAILQQLLGELKPGLALTSLQLEQLRRFALAAPQGKTLRLPQLRATSGRAKVSLRVK